MNSIKAKLTATILVLFIISLGALGGLNYWRARGVIAGL